MKFYDWLDALNLDLDITRYPNQENRFTAKVHHSDIGEDGVLIGTYGNGKSPQAAISDYIAKIVGRRLVVNAGYETRKEFTVPKHLTVE